MKKTILLCLIALLCFGFLSCKYDNDRILWEKLKTSKYTYNEILVTIKCDEEIMLEPEFFGNCISKKISSIYTYGDSIYNPEGPYNRIDKTQTFEVFFNDDEFDSNIDWLNKLQFIWTIRKIERIPNVVKVELCKESYVELLMQPNDYYYAMGEQWGHEKIEIEKVWDFSTGTNSINVGIVDSGIYNHSDLQNNLSSGYDFANNNLITTDDSIGHGTFIAGIIGAEGNNGIGISGINWDVNLIPLQFSIDRTYNKVIADISDAIRYANDYLEGSSTILPTSIINLSLGTHDGEYLYELENELRNYSGLIVCAAGNEGIDLDTNVYYPAYYASDLLDYPIENMIVVGAVDENDQRSIWSVTKSSNYGENTVDIYAPGSNIYATSLDDDYKMDGGTSFAAPYVSGVAALLLSVNPELTALELKDCILSGADMIDITVSDGSTQTVRRLNAWGTFMYMLETYSPSCTLGVTATQGSILTDRTSEFYLKKHPIVKIQIPYEQNFKFSFAGVGCQVDVVLYDSQMNEIEISKTWKNNLWTVEFTKELTPGTYYVAPSYVSTTGGNQISMSISHVHNYDGWSPYSPTQHIEQCVCGATGTVKGNHVVRSSDIEGIKSKCILCGALIDSFGGIGESIIQNIQKVTLNGSYILPNGIIVLVDEDIEAYLNGTLVFYDKNNLPQIQ